MQSDDAPPIVGQGTNKEEPPAVGAESMSWSIATKLGASATEDSDRAYVLCDHRWRWFAGAPREWREKFERLVQERLHENLWEYWKRKGMTPITEDTPWEEAGPLYDPKDQAFNALFEDRGSLAALKRRVVELRNLGEDGCREKCAAPPPLISPHPCMHSPLLPCRPTPPPPSSSRRSRLLP